MGFTTRIKKHLSDYKVKNFPGLEDGTWRNNKQSYSHIFAECNKFDNLLKPYNAELTSYIKTSKTTLDSNFHHLNSSQAMCLNFFYPLYKEGKLEIITDYLGLTNEKINYETVCFEKNGLEIDYRKRSSKFDFYFETFSNKKVYFEIKYTEGNFGKSSRPNENTFNNLYSLHLTSIKEDFHNVESFYANYQILRNLIHIDDNSYVVFVYPEDNKVVKREVSKVKTKFLNPDYLNHFIEAEWNNFFKYVSKTITSSKLQEHYSEFNRRYFGYIDSSGNKNLIIKFVPKEPIDFRKMSALTNLSFRTLPTLNYNFSKKCLGFLEL